METYGSFEYGGVKFTRLVPQHEISEYIGTLNDDKRNDLGQVILSLESAGLLAVEAVETVPESAAYAVYDGSQSGGVYNPPPGMVYVQTPAGAQTVPAQQASDQDMSAYIGQPPAPPKPGSISASLKVNASFLRSR